MKLEQAARQALEAIETSRGQWIHSVNATVCLDTITALREALAEQAEPMTDTELINSNCRYTTPLMAEQAAQEPVNKALRIAEEALVYHTEQTRPIQKTDETIIYLRNVMAQGVLNMAFTLEDAMAKYPEISYWYNEFIKHNTTAEQAEQEPIDSVGIKHDAQLVETFLRCPMTGNQLYFTSDPIQKKGMNYMRLQDGEGNDWTLIARLDEGWDGK